MKKTIYLLTLLLSFALIKNIAAQDKQNVKENIAEWKAGKFFRMGKKAVKAGNLKTAASYYATTAEQIKSKNKKAKSAYQAATINYQLKNYGKAAQYFGVARLNHKKPQKKYPLLAYQLANVLQYKAQYDSAVVEYKRFLIAQKDNKKLPLERRAARMAVKSCYFAGDSSIPEPKYIIEKLSENVNGLYNENYPIESRGKLYFTKATAENNNWSEQAYNKTYYSAQENGQHFYAQEFAEKINNANAHIEGLSFSKDGNTIYFAQCQLDKKLSKKCELYKSTKINSVWQDAEKLPENVNAEESSNSNPHYVELKNGEKWLYFVSDRARSRGGLDIWKVSINENKKYGRAKNVGYPINTSGDDVSPFYDEENNTFYFSSNGHIGKGGLDVFKMENFISEDKSEDAKPINLNSPINSSYDDYGFGLNTKAGFGYFCSNRQDSSALPNQIAFDNIYKVSPAKIDLFLHTNVLAQTKDKKIAIEEAQLTLTNHSDDKTQELNPIQSNQYLVSIEKDKEYSLQASHPKFEAVELSFNTNGINKSDTLQYNMVFKERNFNQFVIARIHYKINSIKHKETTIDSLQKVIRFLETYPNTKIEVASYTDKSGTDAYNNKISEQRSLAAKNYLTNTGKIDAKRIECKWFGKSKLLFPDEKTPEEVRQNRRTEFKVIGKIK